MTAATASSSSSSSSSSPLDSFFGAFERLVCPAYDAASPPAAEPDTVDYVFDHVESFVCRAEDVTISNDNDILDATTPMVERDNSLVERVPATQAPVLMEQQQNHQEGDALDYVFEHVESFVCADDVPMQEDLPVLKPQQQQQQKTRPKNVVTTIRGVPAAATVTPPRREARYPEPEDDLSDPEDEIQLFFRPIR